MTSKCAILALVCIGTYLGARGQKPFTEGTISYSVKIIPEDRAFKTGTFVITVKGDAIRKEMQLNGYEYVVIINCTGNKAYSLQNRNGRKYAIELTMEDMMRKQDDYLGFTLQAETNQNRKMAGIAVLCSEVTYKNGRHSIISYSREWKPPHPITYERFPGAEFLPLDFYYEDASGMSMHFEAESVKPGPVENACFRIPADYKIISNAEYKELSR